VSTKNALRRLAGARTLVAASAAGALLVLGGCADGTYPGAAAVVGGTQISVSQVDDVSRSVSDALGQPVGVSVALNEMVRNELVEQVVRRRSVQLSEAEIAASMKAVITDPQALAKLEADPVAREFIRDIARSALGTVKLGGGTGLTDPNLQQAGQAGSQIVLDEAKNISVEISPRFGKWTGDQISGVSGSLSIESPQTKKAREAAEKAQQQGQPQG
jgi:hypothetical protein